MDRATPEPPPPEPRDALRMAGGGEAATEGGGVMRTSRIPMETDGFSRCAGAGRGRKGGSGRKVWATVFRASGVEALGRTVAAGGGAFGAVAETGGGAGLAPGIGFWIGLGAGARTSGRGGGEPNGAKGGGFAKRSAAWERAPIGPSRRGATWLSPASGKGALSRAGDRVGDRRIDGVAVAVSPAFEAVAGVSAPGSTGCAGVDAGMACVEARPFRAVAEGRGDIAGLSGAIDGKSGNLGNRSGAGVEFAMDSGFSTGVGAGLGLRAAFAAAGGGAATACSISNPLKSFAEGRIRRGRGVSVGAAALGGDTRLRR